MRTKLIFVLVVVLILAAFGGAAGAVEPIPGNCLDVVEANGTVVCFLGNDLDVDTGMVTWTYAVQSHSWLDSELADVLEMVDPGEFKIKFEVCYEDIDEVTPAAGEDMYATIPEFKGVTGRDGILYDVDFYIRDVTEEAWIRYSGAIPQLGFNGAVETDIFQYTLPLQPNAGTDEGALFVKLGTQVTEVTILGPVCEDTTAVNLADFTARSGLLSHVLNWLGLR